MENTDKDIINASVSELKRLQQEPGWADVLAHFQELADAHRRRLESQGVSQRDADFSRGCIAVADDLQNVLNMLIELKQTQQDERRS